MAKSSGGPQVLDEFSAALPPLSDYENEALTAAILAAGVVIEPLDVWGEYVADGHHRKAIADKNNVPFQVRQLDKDKFPDEASVVAWIIDKQLARRNLTGSQYQFYRGKRVNVTPSEPGVSGGGKKAVVKKLAEDAGVSEATILNDAKAAACIDKLSKSIKDKYLSGDLKLTRPELNAMSKLSLPKQVKLERDVRVGNIEPMAGQSAWSIGLQLAAPATKPKSPKSKVPKTPKTTFDPQMVVDAFAVLTKLVDEMQATHSSKKRHAAVQKHLAAAYDEFTTWAKV